MEEDISREASFSPDRRKFLGQLVGMAGIALGLQACTDNGDQKNIELPCDEKFEPGSLTYARNGIFGFSTRAKIEGENPQTHTIRFTERDQILRIIETACKDSGETR